MERQPFPKPGQRLSDVTVPRAAPPAGDNLADLWNSLTLIGRILVCVVGAIGAIGLVGVFADAVFGGVHGDQAGGVLLVFVALTVGVLLAVIVGLDAAFRLARRRLRS
jgi:hypothetical protein